MKMPYFSLYSCIHNYCLEVLLLANCPLFPSGMKYFASWVYMVNNMLLLGKKFGPSTPEVDYFKSRKLPADAVLVLNREQEEMQPDFILKLTNENVVSN